MKNELQWKGRRKNQGEDSETVEEDHLEADSEDAHLEEEAEEEDHTDEIGTEALEEALGVAQEIEVSEEGHLRQDSLMTLGHPDQEKIEEKDKNSLQEAMMIRELALIGMIENLLVQELDISQTSLILGHQENEVSTQTGVVLEADVTDDSEVKGSHSKKEKADFHEKESLMLLEKAEIVFQKENEVLAADLLRNSERRKSMCLNEKISDEEENLLRRKNEVLEIRKILRLEAVMEMISQRKPASRKNLLMHLKEVSRNNVTLKKSQEFFLGFF